MMGNHLASSWKTLNKRLLMEAPFVESTTKIRMVVITQGYWPGKRGIVPRKGENQAQQMSTIPGCLNDY